MQLFAGKPSKFHSAPGDVLRRKSSRRCWATPPTSAPAGAPCPKRRASRSFGDPGHAAQPAQPAEGSDEEQRKAFVAEFRAPVRGLRQPRPAPGPDGRTGNRQGAHVPGGGPRHRVRVRRQLDALYANIRAFNRWMHEEVGFVADNRMFLPPYIALADPELAVKELEQVIADGARRSRPSPARPRRTGQPLRRPLPGRPGLRPVLVHRQRGRHPPGRAPRRHRLPEVRGRLVGGPRRPSSATSTPSSG